jgi:hypothetical protein
VAISREKGAVRFCLGESVVAVIQQLLWLLWGVNEKHARAPRILIER